MRAALTPLAIRLASGAIFIGFGLSKFTRHASEAAAFDRYGLPDPSLFAYAIGTIEIGLGSLLLLGLGTRFAALGLAGNMVGAIATGGRVDGGFVNLVLAPLLLVGMLALIRIGPRRWSLDQLIAVRRSLRPGRLGPSRTPAPARVLGGSSGSRG
jgi:putative oxidoreductase